MLDWNKLLKIIHLKLIVSEKILFINGKQEPLKIKSNVSTSFMEKSHRIR